MKPAVAIDQVAQRIKLISAIYHFRISNCTQASNESVNIDSGFCTLSLKGLHTYMVTYGAALSNPVGWAGWLWLAPLSSPVQLAAPLFTRGFQCTAENTH